MLSGVLSNAQLTIEQTWVENRDSPRGIITQSPRLSWAMVSDQRGAAQSAYQVRVGQVAGANTDPEWDFWDSGKVASEQSVHVKYAGPILESGQKYAWQVRVWDADGRRSRWSATGFWQMGMLNPETGFMAQWIRPGSEEDTINRPSPYFRKEFSIGKPVKSATAYVTSHGMYEARINGQRVGDAYLTPGWTSYQMRLQYQMYDVTDLLREGNNAVGAILGNGWYRDYLAWGDRRNHYGNDVSLLMQVNITYADGTTQQILSDGTWMSSTGPVRNSEIYDGETYDSTRELDGWDVAGYDDSGWDRVQVADFGKDNLIPTENEPVRKHESFEPAEIMTTPQGDVVVDFGQNLVGWVQLRLGGTAGQKVSLQHAEVLTREGNFYTDNLRDADQKATYILNGSSGQVLEPHFTFYGFRYVKVEGFTPTIDNMTAIALYSDMDQTGEFSSSNELLNQLQHNIQWGQRGNFLDVPTDCPQRDERLGWTGDAQAFFRTAAYNYNVNPFFSKWLKDLSADQLENGSVPFVVPNVLGPNASGSAGWGDVATIIPWESYLLYGDRELLEAQYPSMKKWVEFIRSRSNENLWNTGFHFGDWLFFRPDDDNDGRAAVTDKYLISQAFYAYSIRLLLKAARVLGQHEDIREYEALLDDVLAAFQYEYLTPSGRMVSGTQTAYVLALQFDLLPEDQREQAADRLVENIQSYGYHLTTGFLGTPYLAHVLSRYGHSDIAYRLLMQESYPSWLYPVTRGATTIWERWDGIKPDGTFQTPSMNSYNHYAYGAIGDWMYQHIAGIQALEEGPGYQRFRIAATPGAAIEHAEGTLRTYYGKIKSAWAFEGDRYIHKVHIPVNTTARLIMPYGTVETIRESGQMVSRSRGIKRLNDQDGKVQLELVSGTYSFEVPAAISRLGLEEQ
ncbi:family 78 glycoside hydrolase catalytic domain [Robiginitalea sp. SC105]|nr:family 78 glycoside hydrolase catalytic domain [Robiginitalea sp. SC105]